MKVALVHEWLTTLGGSERVVLALSRLFPGAPVYVSRFRRGQLPVDFDRMDIRTTFLDRWPLPHQALLPLMPLAFEQLDLREFDLVISSSHACAKGVLTRPDALHISYCHTPMRYAWDLEAEYRQSLPAVVRPLSSWLLHRMRLWDFAAAQRVDRFIANSATVAGRIARWYRRPADILHPPVDVERFAIAPVAEDPCLVVSRLVPYKRIDAAIAAFNHLGLPLDIIGDGPLYRQLSRQAGPTIRFLGHASDAEVARRMATARAVIFPGIEDFGIVPVEAMAAGRPVVALRAGGALETVIEGKTGLFFDKGSPQALAAAVRQALDRAWDSEGIRAHALRFDERTFHRGFVRIARDAFQLHQASERQRRAAAADGPLADRETAVDSLLAEIRSQGQG